MAEHPFVHAATARDDAKAARHRAINIEIVQAIHAGKDHVWVTNDRLTFDIKERLKARGYMLRVGTESTVIDWGTAQ